MTAAFTRDDIAATNERLWGKSPEAILHWAVETFGRKLTMATAFGAEGCCLIHMIAAIDPGMRLFNLDTGYQFKETLELRERIKDRYGIAVEYVRAELSVPDYEKEHGGPLYTVQPKQCCHDRKEIPLRGALVGYTAWISAIRGDQTKERANHAIGMWDPKFNLFKISPLLGWTKKEVWGMILKHDIPYNPLHDQGFPSIGCQPCTTAVKEGEDERAGRWRGSLNKECGLHVIEQEQGSGI